MKYIHQNFYYRDTQVLRRMREKVHEDTRHQVTKAIWATTQNQVRDLVRDQVREQIGAYGQ